MAASARVRQAAQERRGQRFALAVLGAAVFALCSGFSPFNAGGLASLTVEAGSGSFEGPREVGGGDGFEADALFHTLSSRYGGGGVLVVVEFTPAQHGYSGLLLIDLRHAGLADLSPPQRIEVPNRRQVELYYQEWDAGGDRFISEQATGSVTVESLFRGEESSALLLSWSLRFQAPGGADGAPRWREIQGEATTDPTVEDAIDAERALAARRAEEEYAPDGDIIVGCTGAATVEEASYEEDSYVVEDDDEGCTGDTWEDDAEDPGEESGCEAKEPVDDGGEADPDSGCEGTGDDVEEPDEEDGDDGLYYDEEDSDDEGSGCEGDDDEGDDDDDGEEAAGGGLSVRASSGLVGSGCGSVAWAASPRGAASRARLRRALDRAGQPPRRLRPAGRWSRSERRAMRRVIWHLPFLLLGLGLHVARRRMRRA